MHLLRLTQFYLRGSSRLVCPVARHGLCNLLRYKSGSVLGRSTVLVQDGLDIRELPWIVRRMDSTEYLFSMTSYSAGGESVHKPGGGMGADEAFQQHLLQCSTVHQIIKRLEVPGEQVTVHSAAFALKRICQLREKSLDDVDSFIRKAILHELCETVARDVRALNNEEVISLLRCFLRSSSYEDRFIEQLNNEIDRRLGDSVFSVQELCTLITLLSENIRGDVTVTSNAWTHLASRYMEIDSDQIVEVYRCMMYITPSFRYIWSILDKQLQSCWWKLEAADVALISARLSTAGHRSVSTLSAIGKWLFSNVHTVNDAQLKDMLAMYSHSDFSDANVMSALERYVTAKISRMDRTLVAMCVDFCRQKRFLSNSIMDAVAKDFISHYQRSLSVQSLNEFISNSPEQIDNSPEHSLWPEESFTNTVVSESSFKTETSHNSARENLESSWTNLSHKSSAVVEPVGADVTNSGTDLLDYNNDIFQGYSRPEPFPSIESTKTKELKETLSCNYAPHELVLTLRAYGQLKYLPPNSSDFFKAVERALSEQFNDISASGALDLLTSFVYLERFPVNFITRIFTPHFLAKVKAIGDPGPRLRAIRCLLQLQAAILLEFPSHPYIEQLDRSSLNISLTWLEGRNFRFHQEMAAVLRQLIGPNSFADICLPNNTPHMIGMMLNCYLRQEGHLALKNFVITTDKNKNLTTSVGPDKIKPVRLAVVGLMPEHYCINARHLLGEYETKIRHLKLLGYKVIQIDYETFMWKSRGASARLNYLKTALSSHIKFNSKSQASE